MSILIWSGFLALVWVLLFGRVTVAGTLLGLVVGLAVAGFSRWTVARGAGEDRRARSIPSPIRLVRGSVAAARLLGFFLVELARANLELSRDVIRPNPEFHPAFVAFDVPELGPGETVLMAAMISLTPGTITVDVEREASTLYVHSLYAGDLEGLRQGLRKHVELIIAVRGSGPLPRGSGES
jgi:multicomponent Na+:H+ antiporter subunit E